MITAKHTFSEKKFVLAACEPVMAGMDWPGGKVQRWLDLYNYRMKKMVDRLDAGNVDWMEVGLQTMYHPSTKGKIIFADKVHAGLIQMETFH